MKAPTVRLIALGREGSRQSYGTRRLTAGDEFEERRDVADLLVRTGRAKLASEPGHDRPASARVQRSAAESSPPPVSHETTNEPAAAVEMQSADVSGAPSPLDNLRAEAERLGIVVDRRWGVVRLQAEIARVRK